MRQSRKASAGSSRRKSGPEVATDLSQDCRCKCSSVCTITGSDTIPNGDRKTYRLDIDIIRNLGCKPATGECDHVRTVWSKAGNRAGSVTLDNEERRSVRVAVAPGTPAGTFTLRAAPEATCNCKGPNAVVRTCANQFDEVTINVS
jgi:hypothetical protein